jgi:ubiquinone/menaquinone biosynthesis C-methylase UbiE
MTSDTTPRGAERYVRAAGRIGSTRSYDKSIALTMREEHWRALLCTRVLASVPANGQVVDLGAGTGTLAISLAQARPDVTVTAVDGDREILALARTKTGADLVRWRLGLTDDLPLEAATADAVVTSLVLHHLDSPAKQRALEEVARVLRPKDCFRSPTSGARRRRCYEHRSSCCKASTALPGRAITPPDASQSLFDALAFATSTSTDV